MKTAEEIIKNIIGLDRNNEEEFPMFQKTLQAMEEYAKSQRLIELIKYQEYLNKHGYAGLSEDEIDDYLNNRKS